MSEIVNTAVIVLAIVGSSAALWVRLSQLGDKIGDLAVGLAKLEVKVSSIEARLERIEKGLDRVIVT